jgi:hypothetical protein
MDLNSLGAQNKAFLTFPTTAEFLAFAKAVAQLIAAENWRSSIEQRFPPPKRLFRRRMGRHLPLAHPETAPARPGTAEQLFMLPQRL